MTSHLFLWLIVTFAHFLLTGRWVSCVRGPAATADDRWFDTAAAGIGSLAVVVHVVGAVSGMSVGAGVAGLALWHLAVASVLHAAGPDSAFPPPRPVPTSRQAGIVTVLEVAAGAALAGIAIAWIGAAASSFAVTGADAAHYHAPVAVNLALGASPLDLPATPHLYPMATSALAAWFVLATGDLHVVDLTMLLPFLLLLASVALLFRLMTRASGLAWTTWPMLVLFATPMLQASSLLSADLLFAGAFLAVMAQGLRMWARPPSGAWDVMLVGLSLGLLAGSKATGIPAAVLMVLAFAVLFGATRRGGGRGALGPWGAWPVAAALAIGAGGIWLMRNWLLFGSPIAPNGLTLFGVEVLRGQAFAPTTYLSVLGDARADPSYSVMARTAAYAGGWFGAAYLPWLLLSLLLPIDAWIAWRRHGDREMLRTRLAAAALAVGVGAPLLWMLIGAPWTSLEWTNGYSLRYALPLAVLLPVLSFVAVFPASWRWFDRPVSVLMAGGLLAGAGISALLRAAPTVPDVPRVTPVALALGLGATLVLRRARRRRRGQPASFAAIALASLAAAFFITPFVASRAEALAPTRPDASPAAAAVATAVVNVERETGACATRRFFSLVRFDEPLALQAGRRPNALVFYAAREVEAAARAGPLGPCDYVVTSRAVQNTEKGEALVAALFGPGRVSELADTGAFLVLGVR
jgi:hypothetical protein